MTDEPDEVTDLFTTLFESESMLWQNPVSEQAFGKDLIVTVKTKNNQIKSSEHQTVPVEYQSVLLF